MLGVMLTCSFDVYASNAAGLSCAFGSSIIFVLSNFFKDTGSAACRCKLGRLNLLSYSSSVVFLVNDPNLSVH